MGTTARQVAGVKQKGTAVNGSERGSISRDKVLAEAAKLFLSLGYEGTSLKRVADELGISAPAIYWYFPSKEDLYVEVIETSMREFVQYVRSAVTAEHPPEQLTQMVRAHVTWQLEQTTVARNFDLGRTKARKVSVERFEPTRRLQIEYRDDLRLLLQRGQTSGVFSIADIKVTASAIITMCEYVFTWFNPQGILTVDEVADHLVVLVRRLVGDQTFRDTDEAGN